MNAPVTSPSGQGAGSSAPAPESPLRHCLPLGTWGRVRVYGHWSVLVTIVLVADLLAASALPTAVPGRSSLAYWSTGLVTAVGFWATVLFHELAHALVARHYRMPVRRITLWALGGLTELQGEPASARADALIALAGPLTSLGLGGACALAVWVSGGTGLPAAALAWLAGISVLLGLFNLLPGAPLDGGRLLRAVLWARFGDRARAQRVAAGAGRTLGLVLIGLGILELLAGAAGGVWLAVVGWFVVSGAAVDADAATIDRLRGLPAARVMTPAPVVIADWWTVEQLLAELTPEKLAQTVFPLVDFAGAVSGAVTLADLERVAAGRRTDTRIRDVARVRHPLVVAEHAPLAEVTAGLRPHGGVAVVTSADGHPVGVITELELARAARLAGMRAPEGPQRPLDQP